MTIYPPDLLSEPDQERFVRLWTSARPAVANYVHALVRDHGAALQSCIERLTAHARRLVQRCYFEDLTAEQIAQRLGGNGPAVRVNLQRIREQLRACVERQLHLDGGMS